MPSDLKPTTPHEREKWRNGEYSSGTGQIHEIILRLIADVERLSAAIQRHRKDVWGDHAPYQDPDHESDLELYQEIANAQD